MEFVPFRARDVEIGNPFTKFDKDWALVAAGDSTKPEQYNAMTVSWGSVGTNWGLPVVSIYIRHSRFTSQFLEDQPYFSVSFFDPKDKAMRRALSFCGSKSGRDFLGSGDSAASGITTGMPKLEDFSALEESETRGVNKAVNAGLTPLEVAVPGTESNTVAFEEAQQVLVCRKIFAVDLDETHFTVPKVYNDNYPSPDIHKMFVGEAVLLGRK
jgi:flavin reductase (DIM6/NTAB) family NADH-FMN oxidoreductase RutF